MKYFRFYIPTNADGSRITYSPGWFGTTTRCPDDVVVDLYNDVDGYGIAHTDKYLPDVCAPLTEDEAKSLLDKQEVKEGIYVGDKVYERTAWLPDAEIKNEEAKNEGLGEVTPKKAYFCPICHKFIMYLPENINAAKVIAVCPSGHKVTV
jgi:hypothetical protein